MAGLPRASTCWVARHFAGKSTLASEMVQELNALAGAQIAVLLPMDGFHLYRSELDKMPDPKASGVRVFMPSGPTLASSGVCQLGIAVRGTCTLVLQGAAAHTRLLCGRRMVTTLPCILPRLPTLTHTCAPHAASRHAAHAQEAHARRGAPWTFDAEAFVECVREVKETTDMAVLAPSFDHGVGDPKPGGVRVLPSHRRVRAARCSCV